MSNVEPVEKVPKQIFGRDAGKSDLIKCTTINDLIVGKGQETLKTSFSLDKRAFPTGSLCSLSIRNGRFLNMVLSNDW
jgi:hypothetical protein